MAKKFLDTHQICVSIEKICSHGMPEMGSSPFTPYHGERYKMVREDSKPATPADCSSILSPFYH